MELQSRLVPDTSIVINGKLSKMLEKGELTECEIIIPLAVIDELQAQASKGKEIGFKGLEEIKGIRRIAEEKGLQVTFSGERPGLEDIKLARSGRIDALIRDVAKNEGATLYTSDYVQALVAEAEGIPVKYIEPYEKVEKFSFEKYLSPDLISLHLKVGFPPYGKRMRKGKIEVIRLGEEVCSEEELNEIIEEITAASRSSEEYDIALLRTSALVVETNQYRIGVAKPPFSDNFEITIQRNPLDSIIKENNLDVIIDEAAKSVSGILLLNEDGVYTLPIARALAEKLQKRGTIVKLIGYAKRAPLLHMPAHYSPLNGDLEKSVEFILLNKPDYVVFDEIRRSRDLKLIHELRVSGIGVIAFMSSSNLSTAMTRILQSLGLNSAPETFNIIARIKSGKISETYQITTSIGIPLGLSPSNPSKPFIKLRGSKGTLYEVFEFHGKIFVQDVEEVKKKIGALKKSASKILKRLRKIDRRIGLKLVAVDKIVFQASKSKIAQLTELAPKLSRDLGIPVEFVSR